MNARTKSALMSSVVLLTLLLSLVSPSSALADDPTPPPPDAAEAAADAPPEEAPAQDAVTEPPLIDEAVAEPPADASAEPLATPIAEVVAGAAETGVVLADDEGEPLIMGTEEAAEILLSGDPWFETTGGTTYRFLPADGDCSDPAYAGDICVTAASPIQAALNYIADPANHDLFFDSHDNLLIVNNTVHVESDTYTDPIVISIPNLTLLGDPGGLATAGAAWDAPLLYGPGIGTESVGVTIAAEGVSLIGFIIENWGTAIVQDIVVGSTTTHIENNTIRNNNDGIRFISEERGKPGSEVHYNIFQGNAGFDLINAGAAGVGDNNIQLVNAMNNYWGCAQGPVVKFKNPDNGGDWDYIVWAEVYHQSNSSHPPIYDDNPYPDCGMLYGRDSLYMHGGNDYDPYKIIIGSLATPEPPPPYCGDGVVNQTSEQCDPPGSQVDEHHICGANCQSEYVPYCGDGNIDPGEACDPPGSQVDEHHICGANCQSEYVPYCGDGIVNQESEECDGPNTTPLGATCNKYCQLEYPPTLIIGGVIRLAGEMADITAGWAHTCAITPEDGVICWGNNAYGQLGDGTNKASNVPVDVIGLDGGSDIVAGANHTCVLAGTAVWCWGQNDKGQIGDGTTTNRNKPVMVLMGASSLTAGSDYTCAGMLAGGAMCWGNNSEGQLADGTRTNRSVPTLASQITNVWSVDGGQSQTYALTGSGQITSWSGGLIPVTGDVADTNRMVAADRFSNLVIGVNPQGVPVAIDESGANEVSGLSGVIDVDGGLSHACALIGGGSVKCWGANRYGQLGNSSTKDSSTPVSVKNLPGATLLAVGRNHTCVIVTATKTDTQIECWGLNTDGQLGNGANTNSSVPVEVLLSR